MKIKHTSFSEKGVRRSNQDVCRIVEMPDKSYALAVICDGMGGHAMGDIAAQTVCDAIVSYLATEATAATEVVEDLSGRDKNFKIIAACQSASMALDKRSNELNHIQMGTTMVLVLIEGNKVTIAHCGDSRCYLLRGGEVVYQTKDHVELNYGSDIVTQCFFSYRPEAAKVEIAKFELNSGDRIFLCSDGVYKAAAPEILTDRLMDDKSLDEVVDVIKFLCEKNSDDNYTGVLIQIDYSNLTLKDFVGSMMPDIVASCKALVELGWEPEIRDDRDVEVKKGEMVWKAVDNACKSTDYIGLAFVPTLFPNDRISIDIIVYMRAGCKSSSYITLQKRFDIIEWLESPQALEEFVKKINELRKSGLDYFEDRWPGSTKRNNDFWII